MANVPATRQANLNALRSRSGAGFSNVAAKIMSGILPGENIKVPTDNRQPKARVAALKAIPPHGKQL